MKALKVSTKNAEEPEHRLYEAVAAIKNAEEARDFLQDLCTPAELQALSDRWRVVPMIKENMPYRQIYELTGVSVTTVGRVARYMMQGSGGYDLIYERVEKKKNENAGKTSNRHTKKRPP